jgi:hypothetical protein
VFVQIFMHNFTKNISSFPPLEHPCPGSHLPRSKFPNNRRWPCWRGQHPSKNHPQQWLWQMLDTATSIRDLTIIPFSYHFAAVQSRAVRCAAAEIRRRAAVRFGATDTATAFHKGKLPYTLRIPE